MYKVIQILFFISPFLLTNSVICQEADDVLGYWLTSNEDAKIQIYKCGDKYCGKIYWMKNPKEENGSAKVDDDNPDPELRDRKILGLEILKDFEFDDDEWDDGEIYDPESGNTYSCYLELMDGKKKLKVRGYIGFSLLGRTEIWVRTTK